MKKITLCMTVLLLLLHSMSVACALEKVRDDKILSYMSNNPSEFYYLMSPGSGMNNYIDIKTLNVEIYTPPVYIISFKEIFVSHSPKGNISAFVGYSRYKYDYTNKTVYREVLTDNKSEWEEITYWKLKSGADLIFAMAYNRHFYDSYDKDDLADRYLHGKVVVYEE
ncbi:MAG: hypothetical protein U0K23_10265 [Selenomonadaceae bacterium]|nr:hypothetical protein [Selenomonadaceae bacterium]